MFRIQALRLSTVITVCFCLSTFSYGQDDNVAKAKEIWEKVITAKGGREKLQSVTTLEVSTKSYSPYDKKEFRDSYFEQLFVLPYKLWWYVDQRPGFSLSISQYDFGQEIGYELRKEKISAVSTIESRNISEYGKQIENQIFTDYVLSKHRPAKIQQASKRASEINLDDSGFNNNDKSMFFRDQLLYLMETKWFQPEIIASGSERLNGTNVATVTVSYEKNYNFEFVIDPKTFLPIRVRQWYRSDESKKYWLYDDQYLEDYIDVAGIKFPQIIRRGKKTDTKTIYQVNVTYNQGLFERQPRVTDGPDAWKPLHKN